MLLDSLATAAISKANAPFPIPQKSGSPSRETPTPLFPISPEVMTPNTDCKIDNHKTP
jgi:hypothetical protein